MASAPNLALALLNVVHRAYPTGSTLGSRRRWTSWALADHNRLKDKRRAGGVMARPGKAAKEATI